MLLNLIFVLAAFAGFAVNGPAPSGSAPVVTNANFTVSTPVSNGGAVGTPSATGSPTSWSITAGNGAGDFAVNSSTGAITFTATGQTDWAGAVNQKTATLTVQATNGSGSGSGTVDVAGYADGSVNAQTGSANRSTLLNGYSVRPPWKVAGVDYAVGASTSACGGTLGDPATAVISGVTVNTSAHTFTVTGSGVTIQCWDFSLEGGVWQVLVQAANCTIKNNNFLLGASFPSSEPGPINGNASASNLIVEYNTIDGGGNPTDGAAQHWTVNTVYSALVYSVGSGFTVQYNYLKNSGQQNVDYGGSGAFVDQFNLKENSALVASTHNNWVQFTNNAALTSPVEQFNTGYQASVGGNQGVGCGEAFQVDAQEGFGITGAEVQYNTGIATVDSSSNCPSLANKTISFLIAFHAEPNNNKSGVIQSNYLDYSGASGPFNIDAASASMSISICNGNINMSNGATITGTFGAATCN